MRKKFKKLFMGIGLVSAITAPIAGVVSCGNKISEPNKDNILVYYDTQRQKDAQKKYWKQILAEYKKTDESKKIKLIIKPYDRTKAMNNVVNTWGAISGHTPDILLGGEMNAFDLDNKTTKFAHRFTADDVLKMTKGVEYKEDKSDIAENEFANFGWRPVKSSTSNAKPYYNAVPFGKSGFVMVGISKDQRDLNGNVIGSENDTKGTFKDAMQGTTAESSSQDIYAKLKTGDIPIGIDGIKPSEIEAMLGIGWFASPFLTAGFDWLQPKKGTPEATYDDKTELNRNVNDMVYGSKETAGTHITKKSDGSGPMREWYADTMDLIYQPNDKMGALGFKDYSSAVKQAPKTGAFAPAYFEDYVLKSNKRNFLIMGITSLKQFEDTWKQARGGDLNINSDKYKLEVFPLPKQWQFIPTNKPKSNKITADLLTPFDSLLYYVNDRAWGFGNKPKQDALLKLMNIINKPSVAVTKYLAGYTPWNKGAINKISSSANKNLGIAPQFLAAKAVSREFGKDSEGKEIPREFAYNMGTGRAFSIVYYDIWAGKGWWNANSYVDAHVRDENGDITNELTTLDEELDLTYVDNKGNVKGNPKFKTFTENGYLNEEGLYIANQFKNQIKNQIILQRAFNSTK